MGRIKKITRNPTTGRVDGLVDRELTKTEQLVETMFESIERHIVAFRQRHASAKAAIISFPVRGLSAAEREDIALQLQDKIIAANMFGLNSIRLLLEQQPAPRSARKTVPVELPEPRPCRIYAHFADGRPSEFDGYVTDYVEPPADFPRLPGWPVPAA